MSIRDNYEKLDESWEESGSLIWLWKCKRCGQKVNDYALSMHDWYHGYKERNNNVA